MSDIWNEDGTPKLPTPGSSSVQAFADLAGNSEGKLEFVSYAALQREAKAATPAGVGDIVHYWRGETTSECVAAIVTRAGTFAEEGDDLTVFEPGSSPDWATEVVHDERKRDRGWHWPESL